MDSFDSSKTPEIPRGQDMLDIMARANRLRSEESGRILRRWFGLDRKMPTPQTDIGVSSPTTAAPQPHQGQTDVNSR